MLHKGLLIALLGCSLLLSGCAQSVNNAPAGPEEVKAGQPTLDTSKCDEGKEWWRSSATPKRGGMGVLAAAPAAIDHLDVTSGGGAGARVYQELLVTRGCYTGDLTLVPYLAKSWQVSADGLTWTMQLRDDVKWQNIAPVNGRKFDSGDVKFTYDNELKGGVNRTYWEGVQIDTPTPTSVVMRLKESDADFGLKIAKQLVLPHEVKEQNGDFKSLAIGTGPYIHKEYKSGIERTLVRNPDYWEMGTDGKALPY